MITRRAVLVLVVGFCFYLIALVNVLPSFYYALAWLMAGMLASSMGLAIMSLSGLKCHWKPRKLLAQETLDAQDAINNAPRLSLEFDNHGTLNKTGVIVEITLRDIVRKSTFTRSYLLEALTSGNGIATEVPLVNLPRGEYIVQGIRLIGSDVLGMFRIFRHAFWLDENAQDAVHIVVGPAIINIANHGEMPERALGWNGGGNTEWGQHSDEIRGIRAYAPGDDLRDVHWTSTARLGHLVVKEFARPLERHVLIAWDGTLDFNRHQDALEWGLRFCASIVALALEKHTPCSLLCLGASPQLLGTTNYSAPLTWATAQHTLACAEANRLSPLTNAMSHYLTSASRYGQLYLVTPHNNEDVVKVLNSWQAAGGNADLLQINVNAFDGHSLTNANHNFPNQRGFTWPSSTDISRESASKMLSRYFYHSGW